MAKTAVKDMTQGRPLPLILGFYIPMLFGLLFQYDYCGKMPGGKRSGGGRLYQFHQFYDYRLLPGSVQRICHSRGPEVRRAK